MSLSLQPRNNPLIPDSLPKRGNRVSRGITILLLAVFGWRVVGELPDVSKAIVIAAPHTSNWDFVLTVATIFALGLRLNWMGKHTFVNGRGRPLWHWLGGIPIDRRASHGMVGQMIEAFQQRDKLILALTPEGTRTEVSEWKSGFYHIALGANVPIIPVAFDYGRREVRFMPVLFYPTGDQTADIAYLKSLYQDIRGKSARTVH